MYVCFIIKSSSSGSNNNSSPRCYSIVMGSAVSAAAPSVSREQSNQQLLLTITTQNSSPRLMLLHSTNIFMVVMLTLALAMQKRCQMKRASSYSHMLPNTMSTNCKSVLLWWPGPRSSKLHQLCPLQLSPAGQGQAGGWRRTLGIIFTFWMHLHLFCRHQGTASTNTAILVLSTQWK